MSVQSPMIKKPPVIEPGGLIGILGGGQLGRMTAMAARTMGYRVRVMDPEFVVRRASLSTKRLWAPGTMWRLQNEWPTEPMP